MDERQSERSHGESASLFAGLPQVTQVIGQFVAPATFLAGLLFYWGFFHARGFCAYFGVNSAVLGLSTTDYVMRSADGLFIPLAVYGATALALLWGWVALPKRITDGPWPRWLLPTITVMSIALMVNGLSRMFVTTPFNRPLGVAPSCVIAGLLLLWSAVTAKRRRVVSHPSAPSRQVSHTVTPVEWVLIILLVGGSFFWGATDYSLAVGHARAVEVEKGLKDAPGIVVLSENDLGLNIAGVTTVECTEPAAAYHYRSEGLVLVMATSDNLVAVPRLWSPETGTAVILPRNSAGEVRLEFDTSNDTSAHRQQC